MAGRFHRALQSGVAQAPAPNCAVANAPGSRIGSALSTLYPFGAQGLRALSTLALIPAAAHSWPTQFVGEFFLCLSIGIFCSIIIDRGFSTGGYFAITKVPEASHQALIAHITKKRAPIIACVAIAIATWSAFNLNYAPYAIATIFYATSVGLSISFYFNYTKKAWQFIISEAAPPASLLLAPALTALGMPPALSFVSAAAASLLITGTLIALNSALNAPPLQTPPPATTSVAATRLLTYSFTLASVPVAALLFGPAESAHIALAERTNGLIALITIPMGATLAGHTARAGPLLAIRSGAKVATACLALLTCWLFYIVAIITLYDDLMPLLLGQNANVPVDVMLLFAGAALFSGANTFMMTGFVVPLGGFKQTLIGACAGATIFIATALLMSKLGVASVGWARLTAEATVFLFGGLAAFRIARLSSKASPS